MADQVFKKDTGDCYTTKYQNDFVGENEIMVQITLCEYRELITKDAKHRDEINRKEKEISKMRQERDAAKQQLQAFLEKLGIEKDEEE